MKLLYRVPYEAASKTIGILFDYNVNKAVLRGPAEYELRLVAERSRAGDDAAVERWVEIWGPK